MDLKPAYNSRKGEIDIILFIAVFILAGIGVAMSYSASAVYARSMFGDSLYFLKRQLVWICSGFLALYAFSEIDYKVYGKYTKVMLLGSLLLLLLVLIPGIGHGAKGSIRWLGYGAFKIQPSEFVKIVMVIYLVKIFSNQNTGINRVVQLLIPMLIIGVMFILIMLQPDFGTAIDLLIVSVLIIFVSGFPFYSILSLFVLSIPTFYLLIYQVSYRKDRLFAYFDPWKDRFGKGYHIIQSFIAFKKGGLAGVGLGFGTQKLKRLPEPHTDFIYAVIAEESGLFGSGLIVILFCVIFWRGLKIALQAPDDFGSLLAMGMTLLVVVQAFLNISVVTGTLPTTGVPLPFISYGGSSMLTSMIAMGILLNVSRQTEPVLELKEVMI